MKVARRLVRSRLAAVMVCVGGALLAIPGAAFAAAPWESQNETIPQTSGATQLSTGIDHAQNLIAVWNDGSGIDASVRTASTATWQATPEQLSTSSNASDPDVAVASDGTAVAAWADAGSIWVETRTGGTWGGLTDVTSTGTASSPQVAMVGDTPSVYWIDGNDIQFATMASSMWGSPASVGVSLGSGIISDLAVAISPTGSGAASWLRDDGTNVNVDSAQISGTGWTADTTLSSTAATATSSVAVATNGTLSAVAWNDATGLHAATNSGGSFATESGADEAGGTQPAAAVDANGQVFVASISSGAATVEIRDSGGTWASNPTALSSSSGEPATPSIAADDSGDVVASWTTTGPAQLDAYDVHGPSVSIVSPGSPVNPGTHQWGVNTYDIWSNAGHTTKWTFSDSATPMTGDTVQHDSETPGTVTAHVTETDGAGNQTDATPVTITISATLPTNNSKPQVTNDSAPVDGTTLGVTAGSWTGNPAPVLSYEWQRCGPNANCQDIASGSSYTLVAADVGSRIRVVETATNGAGSPSANSNETPVVGPVATPGVVPSLTPASGLADGTTIGTSLPASLWDGATGITLSYAFQDCNGNCTPVQTGPSSSYTLGPGDVGFAIKVIVTATANSVDGGSTPSATAASVLTGVVAPKSTAVPTLGGSATDGSTLTASAPASAWDGVAGLVPTYAFFRCDGGGNNCGSPIATNTTGQYTLSDADLGSTIRVKATVSKNSSDAVTSGLSNATGGIAPLLLSAPPQPSGSPQDTKVLTASTGSWGDQSALSFHYQWLNCSPTCVALGAASSSNTYTLQPSDVGDTIKVTVIAFVGAGTASSTSAATLAVAPSNTGVSTITLPSQTQDGQGFTASDGAWDGVSTSGLSVSYVWKRCAADGTGCAAIAGATSKSYTATAADVGSTLRAFVSAAAGTSATTPATGDSAATPVIAPRNTSLPAVTGTPTDGQTLTTTTATPSAWDNPPVPLTFGYQWLRCDASGANCQPITGATTTSYVLTSLDVADPADSNHARHTVRVQVTATANGASTLSNSPATGQIAPQATTLTQLPNVVGQPIQGQLLTASPGQWTGTGLTVVSFQWIRCNASTFQSCVNLGTASPNSMTYTVQAADVGSVVTFIETISNILGAVTSQRAPFSVPAAVNVLGPVDDPVVTASAYVDGTTISTDNGTWSPSDGLTFSYQWLRCPTNLDVSTCPGIQGATASTYTLTPSDVGSYVIARVRADLTTSGIYQGYSTDTSDIEDLPAVTALPAKNTVAPTISGPAQQGGSLTATSGTWTGTNTPAVPITYAYQWFRCNTSGAACAAINGATTALYTATVTDVGSTIEVRVIGSNSGGSQQAFSAPTAVVTGLAAVSSGGGGDVNPSPTPPAPAGPGSTGGGGRTGTSAGKTDKTPPRLVLAFGSGGKLAGGTTLTVDATCPKTEVTCTAKFQLLATLKKPTGKAVAKPVSIASAKATVKGGQLKVLKLKLSSAARMVLKRTHSLKVTLTVSVTDAAGNVTPKQTKGITLRVK